MCILALEWDVNSSFVWRHCFCAFCRWKEALDAGKAPPIVLESCSEEALKVVSMDQLKQHALQSAQ